MDQYQSDLGLRLRAVRRMQGLTLADVEARSNGEWKAVVVGSYERGDRAITVARLAEVAAFYGVPISHLLPAHDDDNRDNTIERLALDLVALDEQRGDFTTLVRYVQRIQQERGDYNGRVLTLRLDDLHTVATAEGSDPETLLEMLRGRSLVIG